MKTDDKEIKLLQKAMREYNDNRLKNSIKKNELMHEDYVKRINKAENTQSKIFQKAAKTIGMDVSMLDKWHEQDNKEVIENGEKQLKFVKKLQKKINSCTMQTLKK
ncbi:MAG: hypothetical protein DRJ10_03460 [Bacteroidetes bacterium]|nr:MAG: hypothetical protein DRJ10_03460 [Bacteroidota bacterium]